MDEDQENDGVSGDKWPAFLIRNRHRAAGKKAMTHRLLRQNDGYKVVSDCERVPRADGTPR